MGISKAATLPLLPDSISDSSVVMNLNVKVRYCLDQEWYGGGWGSKLVIVTPCPHSIPLWPKFKSDHIDE